MSVRVVRLGSPRSPDEGLRLGTVRRPPRGVPRAQFASGPGTTSGSRRWRSVETMKRAQAAKTPAEWSAFARRYRKEMAAPDAAHALDLLAALSQRTNFAVGCYCEDESHCHRSLLRALLLERGADVQ